MDVNEVDGAISMITVIIDDYKHIMTLQQFLLRLYLKQLYLKHQ